METQDRLCIGSFYSIEGDVKKILSPRLASRVSATASPVTFAASRIKVSATRPVTYGFPFIERGQLLLLLLLLPFSCALHTGVTTPLISETS